MSKKNFLEHHDTVNHSNVCHSNKFLLRFTAYFIIFMYFNVKKTFIAVLVRVLYAGLAGLHDVTYNLVWLVC